MASIRARDGRPGSRLARIAATSGVLRGARHVALYTSNDGEIDTSVLASKLRARGATVYVPVIVGLRKHRLLRFAPLDDDTPLKANRFGIPEPDISPRRFRHSRELDIVFLPLVAFDADGNRLGMGGGYYDRSLAWRQHRRAFSQARLIGVAYQFQQLDALPVESWDVPIDGILTDAMFRSLRAPATRRQTQR